MLKTILSYTVGFGAAAIAMCMIVSCAESTPTTHQHHSKFHKESKVIRRLPDGRIATQDDSGNWLWFYMMDANTRTQTFYLSPSFSATAGTGASPSLPASGTWVRGPALTPEEEEVAEEASVDVTADATGEPVGEAQAEAVDAADAGSSDGGGSGGDGGGGGGGDGGGGE